MKLVIDICNIKEVPTHSEGQSQPLQFFKAYINVKEDSENLLFAHVNSAGQTFKADQEIRDKKGELGGFIEIDYPWEDIFPKGSLSQETLASFTEKLIKHRGTMPDETEQTTCMISKEDGQELFVVSYNFLHPNKLQFIPLSVIK